MATRLLHGLIDFARRRKREALVLIGIVTLDYLGWLPRLQVDEWQSNALPTGTAVQHVAVAAIFMAGWALVDLLVAQRVAE